MLPNSSSPTPRLSSSVSDEANANGSAMKGQAQAQAAPTAHGFYSSASPADDAMSC